MSRNIHFSRLLDLVSGSAYAAASTKVQKGSLYKDFDLAKLDGKRLRDLLDANLPTFYVVDLDLVLDTILSGLSYDEYSENEDYVKSQLPNNDRLKEELLTVIKRGLRVDLSRKQFLPVMAEIEKEYQNALEVLSSKGSYAKYRNAAARLGSNIRLLLKSKSAFIATDGSKIVKNLKPNAYVVIGPTFNYARDAVNSSINNSIRTFYTKKYDLTLKKFDNKTKSGFYVGKYFNAGHTAAYAEGELLGINMPLAQETQFRLSGTGKESGVEQVLGDLYLKSKYEIQFNQEYIDTANTLLNIQFSFVVTMPAGFNSNELRTQEVKRVRDYISDTILPTIEEQARKKFAGGIVEIIPNLSASPTMQEYIAGSIVDTLLGRKPKKLVKSSTVSKKDKDLRVPVLKKTKLTNALSATVSSGGLKFQVPKPTVSLTNLVPLQNLINANLADQIKKNMGDGNRRDVLNLRTGRLAESAKVERMSESRAGMITAFYSYMKNPYATFSEGGRQQYPRTRDPKLLISKSIREIAQQQVANRLRAVLI